MAIRNLVFDAADPGAAARFWAELLGWRLGDAEVRPPASDGCEFGLTFTQASEPKQGKNRLHPDLASHTPDHQKSIVDKALSLGARRLDLGQGDVPWVVLADPEDNEFCVLEPREVYLDAGALAALVVDAHEPDVLATFWSGALGWPIKNRAPEIVGLRSPGERGAWLECLRTKDIKTGMNRLRLEIAAADVGSLRAAGAMPLGTGGLMADPEGNEFHLR
ncbi:VOC family protein [Amycolatopsis sp. cg5]|uniref:VOC family protein n=1 Tax=Amycolatopsis sp. cg5 TaxID=3238802 RepID=UPI003523A499